MQPRANAIILIGLVTFQLAAAPASASWGAKGSREPDTAYDQEAGVMFLQPDVSPSGDQVYLNGFLAECAGYHVKDPATGPGCTWTSLNPNVATLGTGLQPYATGVWAMLGVWKDCNGDGFVGLGDQGLFDYRADLLIGPYDAGICPRVSPPTGVPQNGMPVHNDGQWVREFLPIGWNMAGPYAETDPYDINDNGARVWMDEGAPGAPPPNICRTLPAPRGTFHSTGALLDQADCYLDGGLGHELSSIFDAADPTGGGANEAYQAIRGPGWGESSDASLMRGAYDCSYGNALARESVAGWHVVIREPRLDVPTGDAGGSPAGTVRYLGDTTDDDADCDGAYPYDQAWVNCWDRTRPCPYEHAHPGQILARAPYTTEHDVANGGHVRARTDEALRYQPHTVGAAMETDAGLGATRWGGLWAGSVTQDVTRSPFLSRDVLAQFDPLPAKVASYYAWISPSVVTGLGLKLPGSTVRLYGAEACGTHSTEVWNGWQCDPAEWYPEGDGLCTQPGLEGGDTWTDICVRLGHVYQLRDVDCYDEATAAMRGFVVGTLGQCESVGDLV